MAAQSRGSVDVLDQPVTAWGEMADLRQLRIWQFRLVRRCR
jgi:hypothetical protein